MTIRTYTSYSNKADTEVCEFDTLKAAKNYAREEAKWEHTLFSDVVVDGKTVYIASE